MIMGVILDLRKKGQSGRKQYLVNYIYAEKVHSLKLLKMKCTIPKHDYYKQLHDKIRVSFFATLP